MVSSANRSLLRPTVLNGGLTAVLAAALSYPLVYCPINNMAKSFNFGQD